jgi:ParB family chromosome partitioning protein
MNDTNIEQIAVREIKVVNPRKRNRVAWLFIVTSIRSVGLKKPILVSRRASPDVEGHIFDLVCGQGRLEAFQEIGEETIPAVITDASQPDQYLMSLVENIARRPRSNSSLYQEVRSLCDRGYSPTTIAEKLGLHRSYINGMVHLVQHGEAKLIQEVEAERLPLSVAIQIANGDDGSVQRVLSEGYKSGEFRGAKLRAIRKLIDQRAKQQSTDSSGQQKALTGPALVKLYKQRIYEQQKLVAKAEQAKDRVLLIVSAMRTLIADEDFRTVLEAENLSDMPEQLHTRIH